MCFVCVSILVLITLAWLCLSSAALEPTAETLTDCAVNVLPGGHVQYNLPSSIKEAMQDISCEAYWSDMVNVLFFCFLCIRVITTLYC